MEKQITPLVDRREHVQRITAAWQNTVHNIIQTGRLLIEAKDDIGYGGFQEMIRAELPFGPNTAQRLMQIAENPVLSNAAHVPLLPASWGTLYELAKLPKHGVDLEVLIEERSIPRWSARTCAHSCHHASQNSATTTCRLTMRIRAILLPDDGATEPDDSEPNPLVVAWADASPEARREFVHARWDEIMHAHDQARPAKPNGNAGADHWAHLSKENTEAIDRWSESDK
jgi:hypothetical protein